MPTRTKEEWEAKQAADEVTKQAGNDERGKWQVELDDNVEKAKGMKGAKFKKERQGVYAIIGRLKALLNGQEVRNETGEKPPPRPAAAESSWDSWQPEGSTWNEGGTTTDNAIDNAIDSTWGQPSSSVARVAWEDTWGQEEWKQDPIAITSDGPRHESTLVMLRGLDGLSPTQLNEETLRSLFGCGQQEIGHVNIPLNRSRVSRGFAFVEVFNATTAEVALTRLDGCMCHGQRISASVVPNQKGGALPPKASDLSAQKRKREPVQEEKPRAPTTTHEQKAAAAEESEEEEVAVWDKNSKKELKALKALSELGKLGQPEKKRLKLLREAKLVAELKALRDGESE